MVLRYTWLGLSVLTAIAAQLAALAAPLKPVVLLTRYFHSSGDKRYLPDGTYSNYVGILKKDFEVRFNSEPITADSLKDVKVVIIANPNDLADASGGSTPPHMNAATVAVMEKWVSKGGGLFWMGNQEKHNLEVTDMNGLLGKFGVTVTNLYTDFKLLPVPAKTPIIGGLRWAYYSGNLVKFDSTGMKNAVFTVENDLSIKPVNGPRDEAGALLAGVKHGQGRVVIVTDAGSFGNFAFDETGIGGIALKGQDNAELGRRLVQWLAHKE